MNPCPGNVGRSITFDLHTQGTPSSEVTAAPEARLPTGETVVQRTVHPGRGHAIERSGDEAIEVNRTTWSTFNVSLAEGQNWSQPYTFQINYVGLWKIQFLLLRGGEFPNPYRELQLYVRIE